MDEELLTPQDGRHGVLSFFRKVVKQCERRKVTFLPDAAFEYWWHLVRLGAVVPFGQIDEVIPCLPEFNGFLVTDRGRRLLQERTESPHDPVRYIQALRQRVRKPDEIALLYLDEAVAAWAAGLYRASAVMLGCACEQLVLILAERIVEANIEPWSEKVRKALGETPVRISQLFELIRTCLNELKGKKQLSGPLADALDRKLSAIFDHARGLRNQSGHPTGADVPADDAEAGLLLFPGFYELVNSLCQHLLQMQANPH
jgi:hypothetical protein